jgi:hypothetical protein
LYEKAGIMPRKALGYIHPLLQAVETYFGGVLIFTDWAI